MPVLRLLKSFLRKLGLFEKLFLALLAVYLLLWAAAPSSLFRPLAQIALTFTGMVVAVRLLHRGIKKAIWRLRNRLVVAYVFIAVVPVVLILVLVGIGAYLLTGQIAVYLVTNELDRKITGLTGPAVGLIVTPPAERLNRIRWIAPYLRQRYPGLELLVRDGQRQWRWPDDSAVTPPPPGWGSDAGFVQRDGELWLWAYQVQAGTEALVLAPLTAEVLGSLVPDLGRVRFVDAADPGSAGRLTRRRALAGAESVHDRVPPPANRFDIEVTWVTPESTAIWEKPGAKLPRVLVVTSRFSAVLRTLFSQNVDWTQGLALPGFLFVATLFLIVELVSLFIGVSMSRTITNAVHNLYEGTERVMEGDFAHRIEVVGKDQLASLGQSFNRMTENLERLVRVEKEKERLQSEVEIAREVQNQLYPKTTPTLRSLELTALCHPARTVSGDYYDYLALQASRVALAIGDVAGKGISAALLMATVQASLRTQIRACLEAAAAAGATGGLVAYDSVPTARLVSQLNQQLYAYTSAEKFATFYFSVYDDVSGSLTYTNAGHPPPILIRDGEALRLETNGMVVGAFPFAEYGESRITLRSADLLVCFTDGITEPENEYGEMFGEDRLCELLLKHSWRKPGEIISQVIASVEQWTNSPELQDDMTLLMAKRL